MIWDRILHPQSTRYLPLHPQCDTDYNTEEQLNTFTLGDNNSNPPPTGKWPISNLGVAERQSGCQAGHLAD